MAKTSMKSLVKFVSEMWSCTEAQMNKLVELSKTNEVVEDYDRSWVDNVYYIALKLNGSWYGILEDGTFNEESKLFK